MFNTPELTLPYNRCVYQRNGENVAMIPVSGMVPAGTTANVVATFTALNGGQSITQTLPVDKAGKFGANVSVLGGWYSLAVSTGSTTLSVERVGAGEVFVIFGHSFLQGGHDSTHQFPAQDDRVCTLLDDMTEQKNRFGKLTTSVGPFHDTPDLWGQFGDLTVKTLGVPVLLYGCAYGGSNIRNSYNVIKGIPADPQKLPPGQKATDLLSRQVFAPLEKVMSQYVPKTGVRALLVEHGYNDRGRDKTQFETEFKFVFDYVRKTYDKPDLALVLVQEELTAVPNTLYDLVTAQAQTELIQTYPNTFKGPDFNAPEWNGLHAQHDHQFGPAIDLFAKQFSESINANFLQKSVPYPADDPTADVLPVVLYNAPTAPKTVDWALLGVAAAALVGVYIYRKKYFAFAFLLLALLGIGRFTNKI